MISGNVHITWTDASHEASQLSQQFGFAWVIRSHTAIGGAFQIAIGALPEDAPESYIQEYRDGVEVSEEECTQ